MTDDQAMLEIHDRDGGLVRTIGITRDEQDTTKWHLAESIALGDPHAETAVIRFGDDESRRAAATKLDAYLARADTASRVEQLK